MNFEKEIRDLKCEIDRIDTELEEVGLIINSRGELSKVLNAIIELAKEVKEIKKVISEDYKIKLLRRK